MPKTQPEAHKEQEAKHTPAPWKIGSRNPDNNTLNIIGVEGSYRSQIASVDPRPSYDDSQAANAALIAAAPELLAACNLATATIERLVGYKEWSSAKGTLDVLYAVIRAAEPQSEGGK